MPKVFYPAAGVGGYLMASKPMPSIKNNRLRDRLKVILCVPTSSPPWGKLRPSSIPLLAAQQMWGEGKLGNRYPSQMASQTHDLAAP